MEIQSDGKCPQFAPYLQPAGCRKRRSRACRSRRFHQQDDDVIAELDERDIADIRPGQEGSVSLSALPWDALPIEVDRISPIANVADGNNVFEVEARLLAVWSWTGWP